MNALEDLGGWPALLTELVEGRDLPASHARAAMATILSGDATAAQLIGFVVALRAKGETPEELSGLLDAVLGRRLPGSARRGAAISGGRHRRHGRRPQPLDQRQHDGGHRRCRCRCAGVQARRPGCVVAMRRRRRARGARRGHRAVAQRCAALRRAGRHRLLPRAQVPSGVPVRRAEPTRDRHRHGVQPARADGQPRPCSPPADRRRQPGGRRADAGVAPPARLGAGVGGARLGHRRAHHHRYVHRAGARRRQRAHVHGRPGRSRVRPGDPRRAGRWDAAAERRGRAPGAEGRARCTPQHRRCSTPPPGWSLPAWSTRWKRASSSPRRRSTKGTRRTRSIDGSTNPKLPRQTWQADQS